VGFSEVDVSAGHDLTLTSNYVRVNATLNGQGGSITALAGNNLTLTGFLLDASGAGRRRQPDQPRRGHKT